MIPTVNGNTILGKGGVNMKWLGVFSFLCLLTMGTTYQAQALTFDHLPQIQASKQWSVQVGKAQPDRTSIKPRKGVYDTYSFKVKNIGTDVDFVKVQAFRDEPDSNTKFALFSENRHSMMIEKRGQEFVFSVFPLAVKAKELQIVVTWKEKGINRDLKETFIFTQ